MRIEGTREFAAPPEAVFRALTDPELLTDAVPGVGSVDVQDANRWSAEIKVPLAARAPRLKFQFELTERREPEHARLAARGKTLGGSMRVETSFDLTAQDGGTAMRYDAEVTLAGLLGHVPSSTVEPLARKGIGKLLGAVERRVSR